MLLQVVAAAQLTLAGAVAPANFVREAMTQHRVVFLGDIHPLAEPKQILVDVLRRRDATHRVDILALEVGNEQQPYIDAYLASEPENPQILIDNDRTLRSHWGASDDYLRIYRAVYALNRQPGAPPIRIVAADMRGWPIAPLSEMMAAGGSVQREDNMARTFVKMLAAAPPDARVLVFMGGYHGLKGMGATVTVGGAHDEIERWFAGHVLESGVDIYTILADARQDAGPSATRVFELLRTQYPDSNFAVPVDAATDGVASPVADIVQDRYHLAFWPARVKLRSAVDAMIILNRTTPITPVRSPAATGSP
jgi:hypothetical protein